MKLFALLILFAVPNERAIVLPVTVIEVIDGDTVNTEAAGVVVSVRLLDCWSPESNEAGGPEATAYLKKLCDGKPALLSVPLPKPRRDGRRYLSDAFTFGRLLGRLSVDGKDLSQQMVSRRHATKQRAHLEPALAPQ